MSVALPTLPETDRLLAAGCRFGAKGTHTSRTLMLDELVELLRSVPEDAARDAYEVAIVQENCLGKSTTSNRRSTLQRMSELFGLDPAVPLFRVLRRLWVLDPEGRSMIALLSALARDPLLRGTSPYILSMPIGSELMHDECLASIREHVDVRLNDRVLDKVRRNACSTWSQSGHLEGRVRKRRNAVGAPFGAVALALWLGSLEGRVGDDLLSSFWMRHFDVPSHTIINAVLRAKQSGLVHASVGGGVVQIDPSPVFASLTQGGR
jgi:hypothetical protein